jgi:hypothetical protein
MPMRTIKQQTTRRRLRLEALEARIPPAVLSFRVGDGGLVADTEITALAPNTPQGSAPTMGVEAAAGGPTRQSLVRFDNLFGAGPGQIPIGSTIQSASLTFWSGQSASTLAPISLHRLLVPWNPATATWNSFNGNGQVGIQIDGLEARLTADGAFVDVTANGYRIVGGVAAAIQDWANGAANHGWVILASGASAGWSLDASEGGTATHRPMLTVQFVPPTPVAKPTYTDLAGTPPGPMQSAWFTWQSNLETQRTNRVPNARSSTFYFAQNGNDATGTGEINQPWKSLAKAQAILNAASGDVRLRFQRGDVWREANTLQVNRGNVTIEAFGDPGLAAPLFSRFTRVYTGGWTFDAPAQRWFRDEPTAVGWLRHANQPLETVFHRAASRTEVTARDNSWHYDQLAGRLYVHTSLDPNQAANSLEASLNDGIGWSVTSDNVRLQDLRIQGSGISSAGAGIGLLVAPGAGGEFVGQNVAVTWAGGRGISIVGGGVAATLLACESGFLTNRGGTGAPGSGDVAPFDVDSGAGGNELILRDCIVSGGALPSADWSARPGQRQGQFGVSMHNAGPNPPPALAIALRTRYPDQGWQVEGGTNVFGPTATTASDVRAYIVGESPADGIDSQPGKGSADRAYVNNTYTHLSAGRPTGKHDALYSGGVYASWVFNTTVQVDWTQSFNPLNLDRSGTQFSWYRSPAPIDVKFENGRLEATGLSTQAFGFLPTNSELGPNLVFRNSVLIASGFAAPTLGAAFASGQLDHNAYVFSGLGGIQGIDPGAVLLASPPTVQHTPTPDNDPMYGGGVVTSLEFDRTGAPRPPGRNDIGPIVGATPNPSNRRLPYTLLPGVGQPPSPDDPAWFAWQERLQAARLANVPLDRQFTYHFAQSGNDLLGDGSQANPFRSMTWANNLLAKPLSVHNGGSATLVAPDNPQFRPDGKDFTIAFWGNLANASFSIAAKKPGSWYLSYQDNQRIGMWLSQNGQTLDALALWPQILTPGWHYFVAGYDSVAHQIRLSIDGAPAITASSPVDPSAGTGPLTLFSSDNFITGRLADASYWTSSPGQGGALTNPEIATMYRMGIGRRYEEVPPELRSKLVAWWTLDEPTAAPVYADRLNVSPLAPTGFLTQNIGRPLGDGLRLRFQGGDMWREPIGLAVHRPNVTIDSYGSGSAFFNRFTQAYGTGWTHVAGNLWKRTESNAVAWLRPAADPLSTIYKLNRTSAEVAGFAFSFYRDATGADPNSGGVPTLYINPGPGINPNLVAGGFESAPFGGDWFVTTDNVRMQNLRAHGAGLSPPGPASGYGLQVFHNGLGRAEFVGVNLEFYFTGYHSIGHISDGTIMTLIGSRMGLATNRDGTGAPGSGDATPFVSYAGGGGQELLLVDNEVSYGTLPSWDWAAQPGQRFGSWGIFQHTNGGTAFPSLSIAMRTRYPNNPWQVVHGTYAYSAPAADLAGVRGYIVGETPADGIDSVPGFGVSDRVYLNNVYTHISRPLTGVALWYGPWLSAWVINTTVRIDASSAGFGYAFYFSNTGTINMRLINSRFEVINNNGSSFNFISTLNPLVGNDFVMRNSIFTVSGTRPASMGGLGTGSLDHNAYFFQVVNPGGANIDRDPSPVVLSKAPIDGPPSFNDPLTAKGADGTLGFDRNGRPRSPGHVDIGPWASSPMAIPAEVRLGNGSARTIPLGQGTVLSNQPVDRIIARFDRDVDVGLWSLALTGLDGQILQVGSFSFDQSTRTATWLLTAPISSGRVRIHIDSSYTADFRVLLGLIR